MNMSDKIWEINNKCWWFKASVDEKLVTFYKEKMIEWRHLVEGKYTVHISMPNALFLVKKIKYTANFLLHFT